MLERVGLINENREVEVSLKLIFLDDLPLANQIEGALKENTALKRFDCSLCELDDDHFAIIGKALLSRQVSLEQLNLEYNNLTPKCVPFQKNCYCLIRLECLFNNDKLTKDSVTMNSLQQTANNLGIQLVNESSDTLYGKHFFPT